MRDPRGRVGHYGPMDCGLDGRVYVVTGGSSGLGLATARQLLEEGAKVVLCGRDPERLEAAVVSLGDGDRVMAIPGDLADPSTSGRLVASANARFGRLDGAVVSVGGPTAVRTYDATDEQWRSAFESVFLGAVRLTTAVARSAGFEGAAVVLVLSTSVKEPIHGLGISNGLRPGLAMVAKELADELGPVGVRVNVVLPGRFDTDRIRDIEAASGDPEQARASFEAQVPLRRIGMPEEFARVATFLVSPAASYVTGTAVTVDGGLTRSP